MQVNIQNKNSQTDILKISSHLFWDIDVEKLDIVENKKTIIHRVLDYGLISDWKIIFQYYGIDEIGKIAVTIKDLDPKSMTYISLLANIPKEKFLCYTTTQLNQPHWNF